MKESFDAIYENGLIRPLGKLSVPEGQKIRLTLETEGSEAPPAGEEKKAARYDFTDLIGKLGWQRDALAEQQRLRDEWR